MICKECGAYNPDHASYCKVCAANLKENSQNRAPANNVDPQFGSIEEERPVRNFVRSPIWSAEPKQDAMIDEPAVVAKTEPGIETEPEIEAAPAKEMPFTDETLSETEPYFAADADTDEPATEPEPQTTQWSPRDVKAPRSESEHEINASATAPMADDFSAEPEDDYDEYEYVPTPPAKSKKRKKNGPSKLFWFLMATLLVIVCVVVVLVVFFNDKMPEFLQCAPSSTQTNEPTAEPTLDPSASITDEDKNANIVISETVNESGSDCIKFVVHLLPNESLTLNFPNIESRVITNDDEVEKAIELEIQKYCYYPNTSLDEASYVVTPDAVLRATDGTETKLNIPSFTITFPVLSIALTAPVDVPAEGIMAAEGNIIHVEGTVYDHTAKVYVNGEAQNVYADGIFNFDYVLKGDEQENIIVRVEKDNCVSAQTEFLALPYVFIPEPMTLTVDRSVTGLRAGTTNKVTVKGTTTPGATLAAVTDNSDAANCGSVTVDAQGNYSFDVTFNAKFYGLVNVTISAVKEGHEDGSQSCIVTRMFSDRKDFIKYVEYFEVPKGSSNLSKDIAYLREHLNDENIGFRLVGKVTETFEQDGCTIVKFAVVSGDTTHNVYVMNQSTKWMPASYIGKKYKLYCSPIGLYGDTEDIFVAAWFALED